MTPERQVLLSLGSNIEPKRERLQQALDYLSAHVLHNTVTSPMYQTPPVGFTQQADFINVAMLGFSAETSHAIHLAVKGLEAAMGREHRQLWREREIDVDIILVGNEIVADLMLTVPHPRFRSRRFVLQPTADIAPDMVDPITGLTIRELLGQCPDTSVLTRL